MTQIVYMLLTTSYGKEREVSEYMMQFKEVDNVHILYGQFDVIVKIEAEDMKTIEKFILEKVRTNKDIESSETLIAADVSSKSQE